MSRVYVIAEAGVNHNGSLELARTLVDAAVKGGADAVKFQTFKAEDILTPNAPKANYQLETTCRKSQYQMLKELELDTQIHAELLEYCRVQGIEFLSSPFDLASLKLLVEMKLPVLKIASGEISNAPLLLEAARSGRKIILSTGMSTLGDIEIALGILAFGYLGGANPSLQGCKEAYCSNQGQEILKQQVVLLHCTSEYPAPLNEVNLRAIESLKSCFGLPVGYSDHTLGIAVPLAAVALGASIIEKHLTLDRNLPGPDHKASLEPPGFAEMVRGIREVEKALGKSTKKPGPSELKNQRVVGRSIVANRDIRQGELFTSSNLAIKRPGDGLSPLLYWDLIGKRADKSYKKDEMI